MNRDERISKLREALKLHEWGIDGADICRVCYMNEERGHSESCEVGIALAEDTPTTNREDIPGYRQHFVEFIDMQTGIGHFEKLLIEPPTAADESQGPR